MFYLSDPSPSLLWTLRPILRKPLLTILWWWQPPVLSNTRINKAPFPGSSGLERERREYGTPAPPTRPRPYPSLHAGLGIRCFRRSWFWSLHPNVIGCIIALLPRADKEQATQSHAIRRWVGSWMPCGADFDHHPSTSGRKGRRKGFMNSSTSTYLSWSCLSAGHPRHIFLPAAGITSCPRITRQG